MLFWRRRRGRILLYQTQRLSDAARKLWIKATRVILGRVIYVNRWVGAIILYAPAHILEPETKLWLGSDGPIGQRHIRGDANDAAPGALADQRPQPHHFEGMGEDVAVGASVLVGDCHQLASRGMVDIWLGRRPALERVSQSGSRQLLQHQAGNCTAAVPAYINDQRLVVIFGQVIAVELRVAIRPHIGDMHIAHAAMRSLMHQTAVSLYPITIARAEFRGQRSHGHAARRAIGGLKEDLYLCLRLVHQQMLRSLLRCETLPVDRQHRVAYAGINSWRQQRRSLFGIPGIAAHDMRDTIGALVCIEAPVHAQETLSILGMGAILASALIGMRRAKLALHLPEQVREFATRGQPFH